MAGQRLHRSPEHVSGCLPHSSIRMYGVPCISTCPSNPFVFMRTWKCRVPVYSNKLSQSSTGFLPKDKRTGQFCSNAGGIPGPW